MMHDNGLNVLTALYVVMPIGLAALEALAIVISIGQLL